MYMYYLNKREKQVHLQCASSHFFFYYFFFSNIFINIEQTKPKMSRTWQDFYILHSLSFFFLSISPQSMNNGRQLLLHIFQEAEDKSNIIQKNGTMRQLKGKQKETSLSI